MSPPPSLRRARVCDLEDLVALEEQCFQPPTDRPWTHAQLRGELLGARRELWLCPATSAQAGTLDTSGYAIFLNLGLEGELLRIAVATQARRSGVASRLLSRGLQSLADAGCKTCDLEVRADNRPALTLYGRHGFEICGRRHRYYRDGCDALTLRVALPERVRLA